MIKKLLFIQIIQQKETYLTILIRNFQKHFLLTCHTTVIENVKRKGLLYIQV